MKHPCFTEEKRYTSRAIFPFILSMIKTLLTVSQVVLAILLCFFILLQNKGAGLSETFGGASSFYSSARGVEKALLYATIACAALFFANALAFILV